MCLRFHIEFVLIYDEHISLLPKILYTETTLLFLSYPHIQTFYASSNFSSPFHILFFFFSKLAFNLQSPNSCLPPPCSMKVRNTQSHRIPYFPLLTSGPFFLYPFFFLFFFPPYDFPSLILFFYVFFFNFFIPHWSKQFLISSPYLISHHISLCSVNIQLFSYQVFIFAFSSLLHMKVFVCTIMFFFKTSFSVIAFSFSST